MAQPRFASLSGLQRTIQEAAVNIGLWHKPVTVTADGADDKMTVTKTVQAAQMLLKGWPTRRGKALKKAKMICVQVIEGINTPETARKAFVKPPGKPAYGYVLRRREGG
jgi:hypothetical protein